MTLLRAEVGRCWTRPDSGGRSCCECRRVQQIRPGRPPRGPDRLRFRCWYPSFQIPGSGRRSPPDPRFFSALLPHYGARYRAQPADLDRLRRIGRQQGRGQAQTQAPANVLEPLHRPAPLTVRVHVLGRYPQKGILGPAPVLPAAKMPGGPRLSVPQLFMLPNPNTGSPFVQNAPPHAPGPRQNAFGHPDRFFILPGRLTRSKTPRARAMPNPIRLGLKSAPIPSIARTPPALYPYRCPCVASHPRPPPPRSVMPTLRVYGFKLSGRA